MNQDTAADALFSLRMAGIEKKGMFLAVPKEQITWFEKYIAGDSRLSGLTIAASEDLKQKYNISSEPAFVAINAKNEWKTYYGKLGATALEEIVKAVGMNGTFPKVEIDGSVNTLFREMEGVKLNRAALMVFYSHTCQYCREEKADLLKIAKELEVDVYLISPNNEAGEVRRQFTGTGVRVLPVPQSIYKSMFDRYKLEGTPANFLINKDREIMFRKDGYSDNLFEVIKSEVTKM